MQSQTKNQPALSTQKPDFLEIKTEQPSVCYKLKAAGRGYPLDLSFQHLSPCFEKMKLTLPE